MSENKDKVVGWIRSGMDYNEGISLLVEITRKQMYFDQLTGRERSMADKLAYELLKASQLADFTNWRQFIEETKSGTDELTLPVKLPGEAKTEDASPPVTDPELLEVKPLSEYPAVIRRVIHEYASLFQERSQLHAVMSGLPESNAESVCVKRAEMFDVIKSISARLEFLYTTKDEFEKKGIIPEEKDVFPPEKKAEAAEPITEEGLKKQKKNLQSGNSKDQTILDYQAKERKEVKNPMPTGTKRTKIEMRMAERNKEIEKIEVLLLKIK